MHMDELTLLCAEELMEDLMNAASSSDEDEEREQKMDVLTFLCAQNLMDDLMDTSSSSSDDDDDSCITMLAYTHLLARSETLSKCKDNNTVSRTSNQEELNSKVKFINSLNGENDIMSKDATITTVLKKSTNNKSKETHFENSIPKLSAGYNDKALLKETENSTTFGQYNNQVKENTVENGLIPLAECDLKSNKNNENYPILTPDNFQLPLDEDIIESLSENEFKHYFHMNRESLSYLMERFSSWYYNKGAYAQCALKPNIRTAILSFLWFCAHPVSFESAAQMFKASSLMDSKDALNIILDFFEKDLAAEAIKLPNSYLEKETVAKDFEKIDGFPNVLGCLAVSYFALKTPELLQMSGGGPQLYLRGICDANQKFLNIKIAFSKDSINDIFVEKGLPKLCFPKYHLLGDATCPIRDHLVIPYENIENLTEAEIFFNTKLARTHVKIKEAFANMGKRFRQLQHLDFKDIEMLSKFIMACCILHNMCVDRQDIYDETDTDASYWQFDSSPFSAQCDGFLKDLGLMKRYELTQILFRTKKLKS